MEAGIRVQEDAEAHERRRQLRSYGFTTGERHFDVSLYSVALRLSAVIDLVILRPDGQNIAIPVDYKLSSLTGEHFKLQLACYGLLAEEEMELPAPFGFLYLIPERRAEKVPLPAAVKLRAQAALAEMRSLIETEIMPEPTERRAVRELRISAVLQRCPMSENGPEAWSAQIGDGSGLTGSQAACMLLKTLARRQK